MVFGIDEWLLVFWPFDGERTDFLITVADTTSRHEYRDYE
jgi:hypothetical protein